MSRVAKIVTKNATANSQGIPDSVEKLREEKGLGEIKAINLSPSLQSEIDSLNDEEIKSLWEEYEEFLKEN